MKRPILDILASAMFRLEKSRVEASSEMDEQGRIGEPMQWSESDSLANRFSEMIASNSLGYRFKQLVADVVAGEYDEEAVRSKVDVFISGKSSCSSGGESDSKETTSNRKQQARVVMFSFTTCPFCRRAKDFLDERGISYNTMELDELNDNEGNQIRAVLGKMTRRTSVPSIFVGGRYIGGCNDGPGLLPLAESGELDKLLFSQ
jgi:glutaredoxin 3